jgi:ethanolamine ammonia-lyase large subunit
MDQTELRQIFVSANEFKEGDVLVGGGADEHTRLEARRSLAALRLGHLNKVVLVEDGVTEALARSLDRRVAAEVSNLSVADLKTILLSREGPAWARLHRDGLSSEVIAAVVKVMSNDELSRVAGSLFNSLPDGEISVGSQSHFGSRIQPNSPGDDEEEILFSILDGLTYGCGDVIIGLNPASDDVETIVRLEELLRRVVDRLELPTRYCVLSDIVKQTSARVRTAVDVGFQSLAGTSAALVGMVGLDVDGIADLARGFSGLYFETGQGSEITNRAAAGIDMLTLESRSYGVARYIRRQSRPPEKWMIVNDVSGFIGPEVFRSANQLLRACLEDSVMAKLHGITMGLDVCATFHMGIDPASLRRLTEQIAVRAAPSYLMAVAGNSDPMLGYMTTSFRDHPGLRRLAGKRVATGMEGRLAALGVMTRWGEIPADRPDAAALYAVYARAGNDVRSTESLRVEGYTKLAAMRERGFDVGLDWSPESIKSADARMQAIYENARRALYATIDESVLRDAAPARLRLRTCAGDREEYLNHPHTGERISDADITRLLSLASARGAQVQIVISDGLNANAINENLRGVLPPLRRLLVSAGYRVGDIDIVIEDARVRAGYHVGALVDPEVIIHLIGERPGTGIDTLSVYITYGRDRLGRSRWTPELDHSSTTALCGIHRTAKPPLVAAEEVARVVMRIMDEHCSGVELGRPR